MKTKSLIFLVLVLNSTFNSFAQSKATVYFIRSTGIYGTAVAFKAFIDRKLVCKLYNNELSIHQIDSGMHTFAVQFYGKNQKVNAEQIEINVQSGGTYYIEMVYQREFMYENLFCQQITPESAKRILIPKCSQKTRCL